MKVINVIINPLIGVSLLITQFITYLESPGVLGAWRSCRTCLYHWARDMSLHLYLARIGASTVFSRLCFLV